MKNLTKKKIYITGASSGIGLETAKQVCSRGADIAFIARNKDNLHLAIKNMDPFKVSSEQRFDSLSLDVADNRAVMSKLSGFCEDFGAPDVLVVNAGIGYANYFEEISYEDFDRVFKTNVYGVRNVIAALLPAMKRKGGKIVIVSSLAGLSGMFGYTAYGSSKFALIGFAESLRPDVKRFNIDVALVCPPEVKTPFLEAESKTLPPESKVIKNLVGLLPVKAAGKAVLKAITSSRFMIIPGFMAKSSYFMTRFLPGPLVRFSMDMLVNLMVKKK
ncbi:SDR family NAD(P)-dependent oxidoreductase [bacterium]|nr:SDR family NAD(P)-dependent oxidoreductase [bacterium]